MAPTIYKSTDTSAPTLTGQVGSLISVLDGCLVNGYGSKTAAGWTKPFAGTNTAVYLGTAGHYLDVNDAASGTAGAQEGNVRGYESMTAVATGTNPFPTVAQRASPGMFVRKSVTADATARGWVVIADGTTFHFFALSGDTAGRYQSLSFGRIYSFKTGDTYRTVILSHTATGATFAGLDVGSLNNDATGSLTGMYLPRVAAGTGTSVNPTLLGVGTSAFGTAPLAGPNGTDGNVYISRLYVSDGSGAAAALRGYLRGLYQIITAVGLNDGDTFTGGGDFAGRTFTVLRTAGNGAYLALETSAWDSST